MSGPQQKQRPAEPSRLFHRFKRKATSRTASADSHATNTDASAGAQLLHPATAAAAAASSSSLSARSAASQRLGPAGRVTEVEADADVSTTHAVSSPPSRRQSDELAGLGAAVGSEHDAARPRSLTGADQDAVEGGVAHGDTSLSSTSAVRPRRTRTAEIYGASAEILLNVPKVPAQHTAISERTLITTRDDGGRQFEAKYLRDSSPSPVDLGPLHRDLASVAESDIIKKVSCLAELKFFFKKYMSRWSRTSSVAHDEPAEPPMTFLRSVRQQLVASRILSASGAETWFIPCTDLATWIRLETVARLLADTAVGAALNERERHTLAQRICPKDEDQSSFRKVLAILILIGRTDDIVDFMEHDPPVDDSRLPLVIISKGGRNACGLSFYRDRECAVGFTAGWDIDDIQAFSRVQWQVTPIFFSISKAGGVEGQLGRFEMVHYECKPGEILPYISSETASPANSRTATVVHQGSFPVADRNYLRGLKQTEMEGGFGEVFCYLIHASQQDLRRYTKEGKERLVAVKKLKSNRKAEFEKEYKMLVKLTPLDTPHLAKLLATYETHSGPGTNTPRSFWLMFERADSNLGEYWLTTPQERRAGDLARWVARQCLGIADGLRHIHDYRYFMNNGHGPQVSPTTEKDSSSSHKERTHGFHGDLKPDNILRYVNWEGHGDEEFGILQITDFGLSSFHHTATAMDIKARFMTHPYRPPESQLLIMRTTQSLDIWTLGCLFMEFLTWLVEGPAGLRQFYQERMSPDLQIEGASYFYDLAEDDDGTRISIAEGVVTWADHLCRAHNSSRFVCDFVQLILRDMLVIEETGMKSMRQAPPAVSATSSSSASAPDAPHKRITAEPLVQALARFVVDDTAYYTERPEEVPDLQSLRDNSPSIKLNATFLQLKDLAQQRWLQDVRDAKKEAQAQQLRERADLEKKAREEEAGKENKDTETKAASRA